jgi:HEAT repeat protein
MSEDLQTALQNLQNESQPLTRRMLSHFSGLSRADGDAFMLALPTLTDERKRRMVALMLEYAEESFEVDYVWVFRRLLPSDDPLIRRMAIEGLWEDDSRDLVEPLVALLLTDTDVAVRAAAATSVGRFVYMAECEDLRGLRVTLVRRALERVAVAPNEDVEVRRRAVESISYINDDSVRRIIDRAYSDSDARMRESAVFAMGRSADLIWADTVLAELQSKAPAMRYEAARACGELQLQRAVPSLIKMADVDDPDLQTMAIWSLGQIGGEKAQTALQRLVDSEDQAVSQAAMEALDELEFTTRPFDLLTHEEDDLDLVETELQAEEDEEDLAEFGINEEDEEWSDQVFDV